MNIRKVLLVVALFLCLIGCDSETIVKDSVEVTTNINRDFKVTLLFEVDGIKVYRFRDKGRDIYFTSSKGDMRYTRTYRQGKMTISEQVQTLCN